MAEAKGKAEMTKLDDEKKAKDAVPTDAEPALHPRSALSLASATESEIRHWLATKRMERLADCSEEDLEAELNRRGLKV